MRWGGAAAVAHSTFRNQQHSEGWEIYLLRSRPALTLREGGPQRDMEPSTGTQPPLHSHHERTQLSPILPLFQHRDKQLISSTKSALPKALGLAT